eukprot:2651279-Rhodomonas_salina.1
MLYATHQQPRQHVTLRAILPGSLLPLPSFALLLRVLLLILLTARLCVPVIARGRAGTIRYVSTEHRVALAQADSGADLESALSVCTEALSSGRTIRYVSLGHRIEYASADSGIHRRRLASVAGSRHPAGERARKIVSDEVSDCVSAKEERQADRQSHTMRRGVTRIGRGRGRQTDRQTHSRVGGGAGALG